MNHFFTFEFKGKDIFFIYDTESGSLMNVDDSAFVIAKKRFEQQLSDAEEEFYKTLSKSEIAEVNLELDILIADRLIDSEFDENLPKDLPKNKGIKALCLHICHDCNMRCAYCFANEGVYQSANREYMSVDTGKNAVDFLIANSGNRKNLEIDFFGGEPLMNFDTIVQIVNYAREREKETGKVFNFTTTTNCLLLNKEKADWLNKEMANVVLSVDGRQHIHDAVRRSPSGESVFKTVFDNAKYFASIRGDKPYYIRGTFTSKNLDFTKDVKFIHEAGFKHISVEPVVTDIAELEINHNHVDKIMNEYEKLAHYVIDQKLAGNFINFFHFVADLENGPCMSKRVSGCSAGVGYLSVAPCGSIYPCHRFAGQDEYKMGNVNEKKFDPALSSTFESCNVFAKPECEKCFAKYHCSGGCSANNLEYSKNINIPHEISCKLMKKRFELALAVTALEYYLE